MVSVCAIGVHQFSRVIVGAQAAARGRNGREDVRICVHEHRFSMGFYREPMLGFPVRGSYFNNLGFPYIYRGGCCGFCFNGRQDGLAIRLGRAVVDEHEVIHVQADIAPVCGEGFVVYEAQWDAQDFLGLQGARQQEQLLQEAVAFAAGED